MKKLLLILLLIINVNLLAQERNVSAEEKIYASIVRALYGNMPVKLWCDDKDKASIIAHLKNVSLTQDSKDADILFVFHSLDLDIKKPKFVGSYALLKHYKDDAIGGFYWQKGRPNLLFLKANLQKYHLVVNRALEKYVEDDF